MGGIERILANYLSILQNEEELYIDVLIDYDTENNVFHHFIPSNVNISYLFDKHYYLMRENLFSKRNTNWINKFNYKILNFKEKRKKKRVLMEHILDGKYDMVINFSNHFDPYINFDKLECPIIRWQHSAIDEIREKDLRILNRYNKIVTICEDMKQQLINYVPSDKLEVLFNPMETQKVLSLANEKLPSQYDFDYFVQVARLDKIKRHSDLIIIFNQLVRKGIKEKLLIIGNGPELQNLKMLINELGLQERCFLLGEIENPYPYIKNAKLFLHTSEREGLPTVLLESMILNTPVIAMDCPTGPREVLDDGKCGELIEIGNQEKFVSKTLDLLESPQKMDIYKRNMKVHIKKFSEVEIKKQFISLIKGMTNLLSETVDKD
ncbi:MULTISPECIES: glycosyltransferase [unclassified Mannheimia]|uniref:glycosyltransferase n=1 Tax=unclassified Mannheimia TaxID=2645054 RepID=UPI00359D9F78